MVRTQLITLMKEDVLSLGRKVHLLVSELDKLLSGDCSADLSFIEQQEELINDGRYKIEDKCFAVLYEHQDLTLQEIRMLVGSTLIATKFERLADHAHRIARMVSWTSADNLVVPAELAEMVNTVKDMIEEVLLCYVTDTIEKIRPIVHQDSRVDYLHGVLSKRLLTSLEVPDLAGSQMCAQLLLCSRYAERMGDLCASIAKRIHYFVTGERLKLNG